MSFIRIIGNFHLNINKISSFEHAWYKGYFRFAREQKHRGPTEILSNEVNDLERFILSSERYNRLPNCTETKIVD